MSPKYDSFLRTSYVKLPALVKIYTLSIKGVKTKYMRVGIISCRDNWKSGCPGYDTHILCFLALEEKCGPLGKLSKAKIVAIQPCPGCPGEGRIKVAQQMHIREKIDVLVFGSCQFFAYKCPTAEHHADQIERRLKIPVLRGSYLEAEEAAKFTTIRSLPPGLLSLAGCRQLLLNLNYLCFQDKPRELKQLIS
ncbi:MAG: hypothetical protein PWP65_2016 [Clostridia bacterium]|nr:hypothetical protein [Clostridia bacterium]